MALINLRNALMTGKRLPYDAEVEYLESTGTQYIDTGCNADGDLFWTITARATQSTTQRMGAIQLSPTILRNHLSIPENASNLTTVGYNQSAIGYNHNADFETHVIQIEQSGSLVLAKIDGTQFGSNNKSQFDIDANFFLFARNDRTAISYGSMIVFAAQFFRGSTMIRDYIPVRKGTVGYLYDRVSGKLFGNAGTGDFQYGQDVVPVEYIESTGTQWVDTGVATSATAKIETKFLLHNIYTRAVYGNIINRTNGVFWGTGATGIVYCNNGTTPVSPEFSPVAETTYEVVQQGNNIVINGENCTTTGASDNAQTMFLFARREAGSASRIINGRIFYHRIYDANGTLVRSFLPVRVGKEGAMMDVLTRRIYRNAGTGAFGYGNDLKYPIPAE